MKKNEEYKLLKKEIHFDISRPLGSHGIAEWIAYSVTRIHNLEKQLKRLNKLSLQKKIKKTAGRLAILFVLLIPCLMSSGCAGGGAFAQGFARGYSGQSNYYQPSYQPTYNPPPRPVNCYSYQIGNTTNMQCY